MIKHFTQPMGQTLYILSHWQIFRFLTVSSYFKKKSSKWQRGKKKYSILRQTHWARDASGTPVYARLIIQRARPGLVWADPEYHSCFGNRVPRITKLPGAFHFQIWQRQSWPCTSQVPKLICCSLKASLVLRTTEVHPISDSSRVLWQSQQ